MIYCFVEGVTDENFFKRLFKDGGDATKYSFYLYSNKPNTKIRSYIAALKNRGCRCLYFVDSDGKDVATKKQDILTKYPHLSPDEVYIVCFEIESWILAGVSSSVRRKLCIGGVEQNTSHITKEMFDNMIKVTYKKTEYTTKLLVLFKILDEYDIALAQKLNESFAAFYCDNKSLCASL